MFTFSSFDNFFSAPKDLKPASSIYFSIVFMSNFSNIFHILIAAIILKKNVAYSKNLYVNCINTIKSGNLFHGTIVVVNIKNNNPVNKVVK